MFIRSFLLILFLTLGAKAFTVPSLQGPVMDEVGLLDSSTQQQLSAALKRLYADQQVQLQVYVTKSLQNEAIESVTIQIFDKWKLGDAKTDKGLLFLIAPNEKRMRIEVGQGLEGDIPDVIAKRIISDIVKPFFQQGQFRDGIIQGVIALQKSIGSQDDSLGPLQEPERASHSSGKGKMWILLVVGVLWLLLFIFNPSLALYILFSGFRGGGGGSGGGGGWSGGGGSSSGGGASGSW